MEPHRSGSKEPGAARKQLRVLVFFLFFLSPLFLLKIASLLIFYQYLPSPLLIHHDWNDAALIKSGRKQQNNTKGGHSRHLFDTLVFYEMPKKTSNKINLRQCLSYGIVQTISARGSLSAERKCPELGNARKRSFGSHWGQFSFSRSVCAYRPILSPLAAAYSIRVPPSVTQSAAMESKVVENLQIPIRRRYS